MSGVIHTAQELTVVRVGLDATLYIRGHGSLTMPKDAAHELARELMRVVAEIDGIQARDHLHRWPPFRTKG